jgi:hypothetical protein
LGFAALCSYAETNSAISATAGDVVEAATKILRATEDSVVLSGKRSNASAALAALKREFDADNWDGNGAVALSLAALARAEQFLWALPEDVPDPEVAADPDGTILLDWAVGRRAVSISIGRNNRLAFAWLDGADRGRGVAWFDGIVAPSRVLSAVRSILPKAYAPFRAA